MPSGYSSSTSSLEDDGEEDNTFAGIYNKLKRIKQTGETTTSQASVEPEVPQLALALKDEAVLARICRPDTESSHRDMDRPKYESELQWRMKLVERRKKTSSRPLLADSPAFDVGLVQDKHGKDWLWIISPLLKDVILKLMKSPSSVHIRKNIMCVSPPYSPFIHRYTDFQKEILQEKSETATKAWGSLNFFLKERMSPYLWQSQRTLERGGSAAYEELWNVFQPNDDVVVVDTLGNKEIHVLVAIRQQSEKRMLHRKNMEIELVLWGLGWDPIKHQVERRAWTVEIDPYEGDRDILSLPIYPLRFTNTFQDEKSLVAGLESRGIRWRELTMAETGTYHYQGIAFIFSKDGNFINKDGNFIAKSINSRLIRAERIFSSEWGPDKRLELEASKETTERLIKLTRQEREMDWERVLNDRESFKGWAKYCPSTFSCVDVNAKAQDAYLIPINDGLTEAIWDRELFLKQLVIEKQKRELLKSLVENRLDGKLQSMGDLVRNKGKGIIVVLHGPPGTGKTLVAESIAEFVKRPLKYVSVGEIIANPKTIERTLREKFDECAKIHAILLMDEADVVLEARSIEDFRRNAVVTTFLSQLEYFEGIMFLTTNRIGTIDAAFMSRIQVAIHMGILDEGQRRILWENWFNNKKLGLKDSSRKALLAQLGRWAKMKMNGREIRNTLNMAQSIAYTRVGADGNMSPEDLEAAANEAQSFQDYFTTESQRTKIAAQTVWGWGQQN